MFMLYSVDSDIHCCICFINFVHVEIIMIVTLDLQWKLSFVVS